MGDGRMLDKLHAGNVFRSPAGPVFRVTSASENYVLMRITGQGSEDTTLLPALEYMRQGGLELCGVNPFSSTAVFRIMRI